MTGGFAMDKNFVLIVKYECGQCAFLTNTIELDQAIAEFKAEQQRKFKDSVMFKDFSLPIITSAEIYQIYK